MTQEFIAQVTEEEKSRLKSICTDPEYKMAQSDADFYMEIATRAAGIWGEDQTIEAIKYITVSVGGLRTADLQAVIGNDWKADLFDSFTGALGFAMIDKKPMMPGVELYQINPKLREPLMQQMSAESRKSFTSDIAYHLLSLPIGDPLRTTQTMHLLLDSDLAYEAAKYISEAQGEALRIAIVTTAQALKDAPDDVKETVWQMTDVTDFDREKLFLLLLNDAIGILGKPELQRPVIDELHRRVEVIVRDSNAPTFAYILGIAKLRQAQNARIRKVEQEAQSVFIAALGGIMRLIEAAKPEEMTNQQFELIWLALKICQEMAQPKAIVLIFEALTKLETAKMESEGDPTYKDALHEQIIAQHIDMCKLYTSLPDVLKEQFKNYADTTITLLQDYLKEWADSTEEVEKPQTDTRFEDTRTMKRASFYQALGEICMQNDRADESFAALTEAQISQERQLGSLMKRDGETQMSPDQLMLRLALSCTNHMLAAHYRQQPKGRHDTELLLETNMNLAKDCFKFYPQDGRVIHFLINAALEVGDFYHSINSLLPEQNAYLFVTGQMHKFQNLRIDETLCRDIAMLHTKAGQSQMHFREFSNAKQNLSVAFQLWTQLFKNTQRPEFQKNADAIAELLKQIK